MELDYSNYIDKATNRLAELLLSNTISRDEKEKYVTSLADNFTCNVFSPEKMEPYDVLFTKASMLYIDGLLNKFNKMQPLDSEQLYDALSLCERQKQNIEYLNKEKVQLPNLLISNIDHFCESIKLNYDNNCFLNKTLQLDSRITESLHSLSSYSEKECNYAFSLLDEMDKNISECKRRRINFSIVKNADTAKIREKINRDRTKHENDSYLAKTYSIDSEISKIIDSTSRFDEAALTQALILLDELDSRIGVCRTRGINIDKLRHKDTNGTRRLIAAYKQEMLDRNGLYVEITGLDTKIVNACNQWQTDSNQLTTIIALCDRCTAFVNDYKKRGWKVPVLKCVDPVDTKNKYLLYDEMLKTDKLISTLVNVSSSEKHKLFLDNVKKQKDYVLLCSQNKWPVPNLMIKDLDGAIKEHNRFISKQHKKTTTVIVSAVIAAFLAIILGFALFLRYRYLSTHAKMPISLADSVGENYIEIIDELEDAGFTNVDKQYVSSGIQAGGKVTEITVDGKSSFVRNSYYSTKAEIIVFYASKDRVDLTSALKDWKTMQHYEMLKVDLVKKGFDVTCVEVNNSSPSKNNKIASIMINNIEYSSGDCFAPANSEIIISFYGVVCSLNYSADDLIGADYKTVRSILQDLGFQNIEFKRIDDANNNSASSKHERTVASISIDGNSRFKKGDVFSDEVKIVITVHTKKDKSYAYIHG